MRALLIATILAGCNDGTHSAIDATAAIDAAMPIDAVPDSAPDATLPDCSTYCAAIQANCTGTNAQYADATACMTACAAFPPGSLADTSGNTLGCRAVYAGTLSVTDPVVNCPHAGPRAISSAPTLVFAAVATSARPFARSRFRDAARKTPLCREIQRIPGEIRYIAIGT